MGRTVAKALQVAGFNVCGWSRTPKHMPGVSMSHGHDGLQTCLRQSHYLVCTLPLTAQTRGIIDRNTLALLPHIAAQASVASVATQFAENWKRLRAGLPLVNVIDRDRGY